MGHFILSLRAFILNIYMENTTSTPTQITVADLGALQSIVDLAASRGAFRGQELTQVGLVYDKLTTFLNAVIAQAKADSEENQAEGSTDTPAEGE